MTQQQLADDGNGLAEMLTIAYGKGYTAAQEKYRAEIDALAARVAEQDDTIRELQDALDGMRGIAKDRQARVQELEAQLASREDDIYLWGRVTEERKRLEAKVAELEAERGQLRAQLRAQLAQTRYVPLEEDGRIEVCQSFYNRDIGDVSSRFLPAWLSSTSIMFDSDGMIELPDTYEIVRRLAPQDDVTQQED